MSENQKTMNKESNDNNKWKDALLKSGLPFEYLVAQKLSKLNFNLHGEYSYLRRNEDDKTTEFSIDIVF